MSALDFGGTDDEYSSNVHPFVWNKPRSVNPLAARAARLWPDSPRNQTEWLRAVAVVRKTSGGWLLDRKMERAA